MKLSIVIPVYNTQDTLARCMESVLGQTFADFEAVLVDDGSPDGSPALCDSYAAHDSRVSVVHKANGGLSDARNAGIARARGEYVTFVDSDDAIAPCTLQALAGELERHPGTDILEYPAREWIGHRRKERLLTFSPREYASAVDYWMAERAFRHTYAWNKVFRRSLFDRVRFPKGRLFEDAATTPRLIGLLPPDGGGDCLSPVVRTTDRGMYLYYWNRAGITSRAGAHEVMQLYECHRTVLDRLFRLFGESDGDIRKYSGPLQTYLADTLNLMVLVYELSGQLVDHRQFASQLGAVARVCAITPPKLRLFRAVGFRSLCRVCSTVHRVYRRP